MKRIFTIISAVLLIATLYGQSPEKISYQAVIRDASDKLVRNQSVGMQISILQGSEGGTAVYIETQTPVTNINGLISIEIGEGTIVSGDFSTIDWANDNYFIKTETDPTGGTSYTIAGTSQLLSVPYALHAKTAETATETDPVFGSSAASGISGTDITNWNNKLDSYTENQNLNAVLTLNNSAGNKNITNLADPVNSQDAATRAYVDKLEIRVAAMEDILIENGLYTVKDVDGNVYDVVKIGTQLWMTENLKTTKYNDGTAIPKVTDNNVWSNLSTPGYCWYDNDSTTYAQTYGALYNWYTVNTGKLCPTGWHVPTDDEWTTLITYLGGESVASGKLREAGTTHWSSPNTGATNETGFTALPGGIRIFDDGQFYDLSFTGHWWSATEGNPGSAWLRSMSVEWSEVGRGFYTVEVGISVRCLRD